MLASVKFSQFKLITDYINLIIECVCVNVANESYFCSAKRCVSSVPAGPRTRRVSDKVFQWDCFCYFWIRVKGSTRVLPFGKPEWHVSTTESDKETVKMVKEEWEEEEGGRQGGRGYEESKWVNKNGVTGIIINSEGEDPLFSLIIKWFKFLILGQSLQERCRWPGCHFKSLFMQKKMRDVFFN